MRIVVSGSYGTGKSTLAKRIAKLTDRPLVAARGMRQFLHDHFDKKSLEDCNFDDLIELGIRRFRERLISETRHANAFVSDGSTLNEWAYGLGRIRYGFSLRAGYQPQWQSEQQRFLHVMNRLATVFREHASEAYDLVLHLPPEFPIAQDEHRPLMPAYRSYTDEKLREAYTELGLQFHECTGTIHLREEKAIRIINEHEYFKL